MSYQVFLGAVDISNRVLPSISVTYKERVSATADFRYSPTGTPDLPLTMIKKNVQIFWNATRIFLGWVNRARWDPKERVYNLECSNMLQEHFERMDFDAVNSAIPGSKYSTNIFGEREDGWRQAQECLRTVQKDAYLDTTGNLQTPDWAAKETADFAYTAGGILNDGAYELQLTDAREVTTQVKIEYQYRVNRWKIRTHDWYWGMDFCTWVWAVGVPIPTREMLRSAAEGTGWEIDTGHGGYLGQDIWHGVAFTPPPGFTENPCGQEGAWNISDEARAMLALEMSWRGVMKWAQTVTETVKMELNCDAAQVTYGEMPMEETAAFAIETDDSSFEGGAIPDYTSWPTDSLNDSFQDQDDDAQRTLDIETLIAMSITSMFDSLRKNTVTFEVPIEETLSLAHTVQANTTDFDCKGKVREYTHTIDLNRATTSISVAISQGGGGTLTVPAVPPRPVTDPSHSVPYPGSTSLNTYIGGCNDVPYYDEEWEGYTANRHPEMCASNNPDPEPEQMYPQRFRVVGYDIEDEARDEVTAEISSIHNINVPQDLLVLY